MGLGGGAEDFEPEGYQGVGGDGFVGGESGAFDVGGDEVTEGGPFLEGVGYMQEIERLKDGAESGCGTFFVSDSAGYEADAGFVFGDEMNEGRRFAIAGDVQDKGSLLMLRHVSRRVRGGDRRERGDRMV